jgi:hypothetical protein
MLETTGDMNLSRVGRNMNVISESKIKHILWNHLEANGYKVAGEVEVISQEKCEKIYTSMPISERIHPYVTEKGEIKYKRKGSVPTTIDLVATDGEKFVGFEVKGSFEPFEQGKIWKQLDAYSNGAMLDEIYVVIPEDIAERVLVDPQPTLFLFSIARNLGSFL